MEPEFALPNLKKRRGAERGSITRLGNRLRDLEADDTTNPSVASHATQLATKLEGLDKDFKSIHFSIIDLIDDDGELEREQEDLDRHDDIIMSITFRIHQLLSKSGVPGGVDDKQQSLLCRLRSVRQGLQSTETSLSSLDEDHDEVSLLEQHQERQSDYKTELKEVRHEMAHLSLGDDHSLCALHIELDKLQFDCAHQARKLISAHTTRSNKTPAHGISTKLPKLDVPTFSGNVLHWQQFWGQFAVAVHDRTTLSNAEKLVYLQQAVRDGSAKNSIEGLSRSGDQYGEAIQCLKERYHWPRLIAREHIRTLLDAPTLKDGSGKELRHLHETLQQHLRALKAMGLEPDNSIITSAIELKLDATTMFEWQQHSRGHVEDIPPFQELLQFIDRKAQSSENLPSSKKSVSAPTPGKKPAPVGKTITSYATNAESYVSNCILCPSEKHPLYACFRFKTLSHEDKRSALKRNHACFNCLRTGHSLHQCESVHRCKKCQRPYHTLLHQDHYVNAVQSPASDTSAASPNNQVQVVSNTAIKLKSSTVLMTCEVLVSSANGSSVEARALLDSASSASFISERLTHSLRLPRSHQTIDVSGIAGSSPDSSLLPIFRYLQYPVRDGRTIDLNAIVIPKITCDLPVHPIPFQLSWSHLTNLPLADPSFGQPGRINILLGVDIFVDILRQGRRVGPPGSPAALETEFGWVLSGNARIDSPSDPVSPRSSTSYNRYPRQRCAQEILGNRGTSNEQPRPDS